MSGVTLLPLMAVPRVAEDALTLAAQFSDDLSPVSLGYAVYPIHTGGNLLSYPYFNYWPDGPNAPPGAIEHGGRVGWRTWGPDSHFERIVDPTSGTPYVCRLTSNPGSWAGASYILTDYSPWNVGETWYGGDVTSFLGKTLTVAAKIKTSTPSSVSLPFWHGPGYYDGVDGPLLSGSGQWETIVYSFTLPMDSTGLEIDFQINPTAPGSVAVIADFAWVFVGVGDVEPEMPPVLFGTKTIIDPSRGMTIEATVDGLVPGTEYQTDVDGLATTGTSYSASQAVTWAPDTNLYPGADGSLGVGPRDWAFEDPSAVWFGMLPWYYQGEPLFTALLDRLGQEMQRVSAAIEEVSRFTMPTRSYGAGLARWEQLLDVKPGEDSPPEQQRRGVVVSQLRTRMDHSAAAFVQAISTILGGAEALVREDFANYTIQFEAVAFGYGVVAKDVMDRIKPAHLILDYIGTFRAGISLAGDPL